MSNHRWAFAAGPTVLVAIVLLGATANSRHTEQTELVAVVDGHGIPASDFAAYDAVLTSPEGIHQVSRSQILTSLINQVLVSREADRLGLRPDDLEVEGVINMWEQLGVTANTLDRSGGRDGLRERARMFSLFRQVKAAVVGAIPISDQQIVTAQMADPLLRSMALDSEVASRIRTRLEEVETGQRWANWLTERRRCASISVLDTSTNVPSSTPGPGCPAL